MTDFRALAIADVVEVTPPRFGDHRGYFSETYSRQAFADAGLDIEWVQDNQSLSAEMGTVRGLHFQAPPAAQAKLVRVLSSTSEFLGGAQGLGGPAMPRTVFDLSFISAAPFYYIFLGVLAFLLGLTWWMERGRMGFYLRAIKDSERAARSLGVSAGRYKLYAYMLSGAFTSLAGSLYLCMFGFVDPESGFGILISVKMVVMAALGGAGQLFGPLVGALILVPLEELSNSYLGGRGAGLTFVVYGAIIVIIARVLPSGLLSLFERRPAKPAPKSEPKSEIASGHAD